MTDGIQVFEGNGIDPPDEFTQAVNDLTPIQLQRLMMVKAALETGNWEIKSLDLSDYPKAIRERFGLD